MKKKRVRKTKIDKKAVFRKQNRKLFGIFVLIFSFILLINGTLSWSSYAEWVKNHMQSKPEEIAVKVVELFDPQTPILYEKDKQKEVKVKNISTRPAIVRVQLKESFLPFKIDTTNGPLKGNGSLKQTHKNFGDKEINDQFPQGWEEDHLYDSGEKDDKGKKLYYTATTPIHQNIPYQFPPASSRPKELSNFQLNFHKNVKQIAASTSYDTAWYYEDGYFYYSNVLEAGETTQIELLQSITMLNSNLPNEFKHSLYNVEVEAYGISPSKAGLKQWTTSIPLLNMYALDPEFIMD